MRPCESASQGGDGALPVPVQEAYVHARVPDDAGWHGSSRYRIRPCCLLLPRRHRHPGLHCFCRSQPGLHTPLSTLRVTPRGATCMTRGRCGSLPLHRSGLSPLTSCRSPGAPWLNPPPHPITVYASHPPSPTTAQHSLPDSALPPYRGRSFTGRNASASPDAPEPEVRIHLPPAESPQTFGSACPYDALALRALLREAHLLAV